MSRLTIEKPIRSLGRFFAYLPDNEKKTAVQLAKSASRLPKCVIETEYYRLEKAATDNLVEIMKKHKETEDEQRAAAAEGHKPEGHDRDDTGASQPGV